MSEHFLKSSTFDEVDRIRSILNYEILDTANEEQLDELTKLTASIFQVPIVLITIIDEKRQWFKSNYGLSIKETARSISFCQYTILGKEIFEVENALQDERFEDNPLVTKDPNIRFYCGAPLINEEGYKMGSLALIDRHPRKLDSNQKKTLKLLAQQVVNNFELKMQKKQLENEKLLLETRVAERTKELEEKILLLDKRDKKLDSLNNELNRLIYKASHDLMGPLKTMQGVINLALHETEEDCTKKYLQLLYDTDRKLDQALIALLKVASIQESSNHCFINWDSLLHNAASNALLRTKTRKLNFKVLVKPNIIYWSDPTLLEIMMEELIVNSILYNKNEVPKIKVDVWVYDNMLNLVFKDNGIGFLAEGKEKIFQMFYKTPLSQGSGLGLYIVRNVVEKLEGEIGYETESNVGTKFFISLPFRS
jgi:signal transduction histidine kinase